MEKIAFFKAITYGNHEQSTSQFLLEKVDHYFYLGGRKAKVIRGKTEGNSQGVELVNVSISLLEMALKIASYCTIVIPTLFLVAKTILRSRHKFHLIVDRERIPNSQPVLLQVENNRKLCSAELIRLFWEQHIQSFKICHGTSSLYYKHFKEKGISASYPEALENLIAKVRKLWRDHEHEFIPRTDYFRMFEYRYDKARQKGEVTLSFSANEWVTKEFTTGARRGGEWIRELRNFLSEASTKKEVFSVEEQKTLLETEALMDLILSAPPMQVKVAAGCPDLELAPIFAMYTSPSLLLSLRKFENYIKLHCPQWEVPDELLDYMNTSLLPELKSEKERIKTHYELILHSPIQPQYLEFEFIKENSITLAK